MCMPRQRRTQKPAGNVKTEPLTTALQALGTWLITDLRDWLQTEYTRVGSPYGVNEAGFTQWLAEVAVEVQRQNANPDT